MEVKERIAYVRGLLEGADFYGRDERGRAIWENLLGICSQLADAVEMLEEEQDELEAYIAAVDADLSDLEEESEVSEYVVVECPRCGEEVCFEEDLLFDDETQVSCPECGEELNAFSVSSNGGDEGRNAGSEASWNHHQESVSSERM